MKQNSIKIGRRKEAVARVRLTDGAGKVTVNGKDYKTYFPLEYLQKEVEAPLIAIEELNKYDVIINVRGGGIKGQAQAAKLGIARILADSNPDFKSVLKAAKMLTRDSRMVERKKPGRKKARKRFQFSKR